MEIIKVAFEQTLTFDINGEIVKLIPFLTLEHGLVKLGIDAPSGIRIDREEISLKHNAKGES